jgi:hypothetical protein
MSQSPLVHLRQPQRPGALESQRPTVPHVRVPGDMFRGWGPTLG